MLTTVVLLATSRRRLLDEESPHLQVKPGRYMAVLPRANFQEPCSGVLGVLYYGVLAVTAVPNLVAWCCQLADAAAALDERTLNVGIIPEEGFVAHPCQVPATVYDSVTQNDEPTYHAEQFWGWNAG